MAAETASSARRTAQPAAPGNAQRKSLQLIRQLPDGITYELCDEAVAELLAVGDCPTAVVSIAGVTRTGKSYLLNRLAEAAGGFAVGHSVKPCTHGIWMWPDLVSVSGKEHKMVFLDSEGVASSEQTAQASATMVALAGLVSSLLIYNHSGTFDENCIGGLCQAAAILKGLFDKRGCSAVDGLSACDPPALLLLLRDFDKRWDDSTDEDSSSGEVHNESASANRYMERTLDDRPLVGAQLSGIRDQNSMRATIKEIFTRRDCLALPVPCVDTKHMESLPDSALAPSFLEGLASVKEFVFGGVAPKTFKRTTMTGKLLVDLLKAAVAAVNKPGGTLNIGSMWSAMLEAELRAAQTAAYEAYNAASTDQQACNTPEEAEAIHKVALTAAGEAFIQATRFADDMSRAGAMAVITKQLTDRFTAIIERIKGRLIKRQLEYEQLLNKAKSESLVLLDYQGVMAGLADCADEQIALQHVKGAADMAWQAFDTTVAAWKGDPPAASGAGLAAARQDVQAAIDGLQATAVHAVKAVAAANEAKASAADKARLQEQIMLDAKITDALLTALQQYKRDMRDIVRNNNSVTDVEKASEEALTKIVRQLPADLPADRLSDLKAELEEQCEDIYDRSISVVEQRAASMDQAILASAARKAMQSFRESVRSISEGNETGETPSVKKATKACEEAKVAALQKFHVEARQPSYSQTSQEYDNALQSLISDIDSWTDKLIEGVSRGIQAAADLAKVRADTQEALKQQKEKADASAQAWLAKEQQLVKQHEDRLALISTQNNTSRRDDSQMMSMFAQMMQQMMQMSFAANRGYGGGPGGGCYTQSATVEEIGSSAYGRGSPSGHRGRIGITLKGAPCKRCMAGHRCPINHAQYQ